MAFEIPLHPTAPGVLAIVLTLQSFKHSMNTSILLRHAQGVAMAMSSMDMTGLYWLCSRQRRTASSGTTCNCCCSGQP